jgi:hypothetical protein
VGTTFSTVKPEAHGFFFKTSMLLKHAKQYASLPTFLRNTPLTLKYEHDPHNGDEQEAHRNFHNIVLCLTQDF